MARRTPQGPDRQSVPAPGERSASGEPAPTPGPELTWASDRALLIRWPGGVRAGVLDPAPRQLWRRLVAARPTGVLDVQPAWSTVLVTCDPAVLPPERLAAWVREVLAVAEVRAAGPPGVPEISPEPATVLAVSFAPADAPDLSRLAAAAGLNSAELVERLLAAEFTVGFLGFAPGFPYCSGLPAELATARLSSPRRRVPAGSVAIAGPFLGIYPRSTPGGWNLVGRTAAVLFDPERSPASRLLPGQRFRRAAADPGKPGGGSREQRDPKSGAAPARSRRLRAGTGGVLEVLDPGLLALVQDLGRPGFAHLGVSPSGAADPLSLRVGNRLLGNADGAAGLELLLGGGAFRVWQPSRVVLTGSDFAAWHVRPCGERMAVAAWQEVSLAAGDQLELGPTRGGARAYLCVAGGVAAPLVLGSRSTHVSSGLGDPGRPLRAGDTLPLGPPPPIVQSTTSRRSPDATTLAALVARIEEWLFPSVLRVTPGAQLDWFRVRGGNGFPTPGEDEIFTLAEDASGNVAVQRVQRLEDLLGSQILTVSEEADRFGIRLTGAALERVVEGELETEGAPWGAVQVTPDGRLVILGPDHQTTGGYPKVANVVAADLAAVGQLRPRMAVRLSMMTCDQAVTEYRARGAWLDRHLPAAAGMEPAR